MTPGKVPPVAAPATICALAQYASLGLAQEATLAEPAAATQPVARFAGGPPHVLVVASVTASQQA